MRSPNPNDGQSKYTTAAGLPKTIAVHNAANQGPGPVNNWTPNSFDVLEYNYGPFVVVSVGAGYKEVQVQEPGIYDYNVQALWTATGGAGGVIILHSSINDGGAAGAGLIGGNPRFDLNTGTAGNPSGAISGELQLRAGDVLGFQWWSNYGATMLAGYCRMTVTKKGGQY